MNKLYQIKTDIYRVSESKSKPDVTGNTLTERINNRESISPSIIDMAKVTQRSANEDQLINDIEHKMFRKFEPRVFPKSLLKKITSKKKKLSHKKVLTKKFSSKLLKKFNDENNLFKSSPDIDIDVANGSPSEISTVKQTLEVHK